MKHISIFVFVISVIFNCGISLAGDNENPLNYHLSFENFEFLDDCFIARSGHKTIEDRGLLLTEGLFGKGLQMTHVPVLLEGNDRTHLDLDLIVGSIYITRSSLRKTHKYDEPVLWGAGKLNASSGAVSFWVKGKITEGQLFNQSACSWGRKDRFLLAITVDDKGEIGAYLTDSRYVRHTIESGNSFEDMDTRRGQVVGI